MANGMDDYKDVFDHVAEEAPEIENESVTEAVEQVETTATETETLEPSNDQAPQDGKGLVPSFRLREEAEARRAAEAALKEQAEKINAMQAQMEMLARFVPQKQAAQPEVKPLSFYDDPDAYMAQIEQKMVMSEKRAELLNDKIQALAEVGPETLLKAEQEFEKAAAKDPALLNAALSSPSPHRFAVRWYKQNEIMSKVGDDPEAYFERKLQERMQDPAFVQSLQGQVRQAAVQNSANRQPVVNIPPSLSKATQSGGGNVRNTGDDDFSDIFAPRR